MALNNNFLDELVYFNTILNYAQLLEDSRIEETRNERLDRIEEKLDFLIKKIEEMDK